jgi:peptide/nickel transport system ATP-binding protein
LLSSVPKPDPRALRSRKIPEGEVADPAHPPPGCRFHPRCPYVQSRCSQEEPVLREFPGGRTVACHFAERLTLTGALLAA